jgi:hypothetical protein
VIRDAAAQAWPPFVLVAGMLLVGEPEQGDDGWISVSAVIVVAVLVVSLDDPALPVLGVGVVAVLASRVGRRPLTGGSSSSGRTWR